MRLLYKYRGTEFEIRVKIGSYENRNLAIVAYAKDDLGWMPWTKVTTNTNISLPKDHSLINVNNDGEIIELIKRYALALPTGKYIPSGYVLYPEYQFDEKVLRELDPEGYSEYLERFSPQDSD